MEKLTQTNEEMLDALYTRAEELALLCLKVNQEGLAQTHFDMSGHVNTAHILIYGVGAVFEKDFEFPKPLKRLHLELYLSDYLEADSMHRYWEKSMVNSAELIDYLEELLEAGEKIMHPEQKPREQGAA